MASEKSKTDSSSDSALSISDIQKLLPHRYPFLLVDRMLKIEGDHGIGIKNVSIGEPFFEGHFPAFPVMPGVLIVEAMAQTAGLVWYKKEGLTGSITFLTGLDNVRFREPVIPGDQLILDVKLVKQKARLVVAEGVARVKEKVVCEATLMFMVDTRAR